MQVDRQTNQLSKLMMKIQTVAKLLTNHSTNKLDKLILDNNTEHVFAYAETALNQ